MNDVVVHGDLHDVRRRRIDTQVPGAHAEHPEIRLEVCDDIRRSRREDVQLACGRHGRPPQHGSGNVRHSRVPRALRETRGEAAADGGHIHVDATGLARKVLRRQGGIGRRVTREHREADGAREGLARGIGTPGARSDERFRGLWGPVPDRDVMAGADKAAGDA